MYIDDISLVVNGYHNNVLFQKLQLFGSYNLSNNESIYMKMFTLLHFD